MTHQTSHNELSDQELMQAVTSGDSVAFETLYDRYSPIVLGLTNKILGDRAAAEEVMQEVFWRLWQQGDRYNSQQGAFSAWLLRIARNLAIDTWRRRVRMESDSDKVDARLHTDAEIVPQATWLAEREAEVRTAVAALPPEQRHVIELAFFHGKTRREIAAENDVPLGTVHTRARLALKKLRQTLENRGLGD